MTSHNFADDNVSRNERIIHKVDATNDCSNKFTKWGCRYKHTFVYGIAPKHSPITCKAYLTNKKI